MRSAPLFFVRSGLVYANGHYLSNVGINGYYRSSVANSSSEAYYLQFDSSFVYPSNSYDGYNGQSVRCVTLSN